MEMDWMTILREIRHKNQEETKNMTIDEKMFFENECREEFLKEIKRRKDLKRDNELIEA